MNDMLHNASKPIGGAIPVPALVAARSVLAERERELVELKGPCSNPACPLHYARSGPCDTAKETS